MRRLNEILDVPKVWYKRSLMQRLFLGKEGALATKTSINQPTSKTTPADTSKQSSTVEEPTAILSTPDSTPRLNRNRTPGENYHVEDFGEKNSFYKNALCLLLS